jgi:hypothetical protein
MAEARANLSRIDAGEPIARAADSERYGRWTEVGGCWPDAVAAASPAEERRARIDRPWTPKVSLPI